MYSTKVTALGAAATMILGIAYNTLYRYIAIDSDSDHLRFSASILAAVGTAMTVTQGLIWRHLKQTYQSSADQQLQLTKQQQKLQDATDKLRGLSQNYPEETASSKFLNAMVQEMHRPRKGLETALKALENENATLNSQILEKDGKIVQIEDENGRLKEKVQEVKQKFNKLQEEKMGLSRELEEAKDAANQLKLQLQKPLKKK